MSKILLNNDAHIFQMLGCFDQGHGYALTKEIAETLLKMPKKPIVSKDEIDVGANIAFLQGDFEIEGAKPEFVLENSTLFLLERASEMGGVLAFSYLTPLGGELTLDYFKALDANVDLTPIKERVKQRRQQYANMLSEHERLAGRAMRRVQKTLATQPMPEFSELMSVAKRYIRPGKPDFNTSQLQILSYVIDKKNMTHPAAEIISRWKTSTNNKTSAALVSEAVPELHDAKITGTKKTSGGKSKKLDFNSLLAAMMKQEAPKSPRPRIKPSNKVAELLNAENEVEQEFEPENIQGNDGKDENADGQTEQLTNEENKLKQLVSELLKKQNNKTVMTIPKSSLKGKRQVELSQHVPASSNPDHEL